MTSANEQQHEQGVAGEPTEAAEILHGDRARTEEHEQPATVALDGDTLIAKDEDDDE